MARYIELFAIATKILYRKEGEVGPADVLSSGQPHSGAFIQG